MQTKNERLSIITNFGCDKKCWYCIWKSHKFNQSSKYITNVERTDWNKLKNFVLNWHDWKNINISGGGDPLYHYNKNCIHWNYYEKLFEVLNKRKVDIHTRIKTKDSRILSRMNKYVYSFDFFEDLDDNYFNFLIDNWDIKIRIVKVIQRIDTDLDILRIIKTYNKYQITFKQLHTDGFMDADLFIHCIAKFNQLSHKFKNIQNVLFQKSDDYNYYFMPDNNLYGRFLL